MYRLHKASYAIYHVDVLGRPQASLPCTLLQAAGHVSVGGADEAGRGPLAGPVVAAVCVLPHQSDTSWQMPAGLNDSKAITEDEREAIFEALTTDSRVRWAVSIIDHETIDRINILQVCEGLERVHEHCSSCDHLNNHADFACHVIYGIAKH